MKDQIIRIAVNLEYTSENIKLSNKDEIALFPPVSGGLGAGNSPSPIPNPGRPYN